MWKTGEKQEKFRVLDVDGLGDKQGWIGENRVFLLLPFIFLVFPGFFQAHIRLYCLIFYWKKQAQTPGNPRFFRPKTSYPHHSQSTFSPIVDIFFGEKPWVLSSYPEFSTKLSRSLLEKEMFPKGLRDA
ncbi:MAG: hypothetical protein IJ181_07125 [Acidaminococcaceae bacterium]|nr:hypothetical protein [Acidaminococcaceae bacterium]